MTISKDDFRRLVQADVQTLSAEQVGIAKHVLDERAAQLHSVETAAQREFRRKVSNMTDAELAALKS